MRILPLLTLIAFVVACQPAQNIPDDQDTPVIPNDPSVAPPSQPAEEPLKSLDTDEEVWQALDETVEEFE